MAVTVAPAQRGIWLILLAALVIWCGNLENRKLALSDEGRYSEIPRYMAQSGDWLTPRLNGIKYFEKPPLQYWATAAAYRLFGEHHWSARLWPALTGFLGILLIFYTGSRLFGMETGLYSALVLGSSLIYVAMGHILTLDMGLTFFLTLALSGILLGLDARTGTAACRGWLLVAAAGCALAVLSKGLIGIVLPAAAVGLYLLLTREFSLLRMLHLGYGSLTFMLLCAPWFIAVSLANPEFPHFFFIHEHVQRYATNVHARYQPWYFFIPILLLGIVPWVVTLFDALHRALKRTRSREFDPVLFLLLWTGFTFVFFSLSSSKLASYILPIFPALALLMGLRLSSIRGRTLAWQLAPLPVIAALGLMGAPHVVKLASEAVPAELYGNQVPWLAAAALALLVGSCTAIWLARRGRVRHAVVACAFTGLLTTQLLIRSHDELSPTHSTYHLVKQLQPFLRPGVPFYSVGSYEQTLPFYLKRTVTLVAFQDEMAFGLRQEPHLWVPDLVTFKRVWLGHDYALAAMGVREYEEMRQANFPMLLIARDTERAFVRTPMRHGSGGMEP